MTDEDDGVRHSKALDAELIVDPTEKAERESYNALQQIRVVEHLVQDFLAPERPFKLRPSMILNLHRVALNGLSGYAGTFRPADIEIGKSKHTPVGAHMVSELIEDMCDYVNQNWASERGIHLAAFVMWRLNWIHPFTDGNGRTARAAAYFVLNVHEGFLLPGTKTIPEQIMDRRGPYYDALEEADKAGLELANLKQHLAPLEDLLTSLLSAQLVSAVEKASGTALSP